jgi:hypothetical protein
VDVYLPLNTCIHHAILCACVSLRIQETMIQLKLSGRVGFEEHWGFHML